MATDCEFLLDVLKDHQWHSTSELLRYSIEERGCGLTVHSRVAQLRTDRGLTIEHRRVRGERANAHQYRLVATAQAEAEAERLGPDGSPLLGPLPCGPSPADAVVLPAADADGDFLAGSEPSRGGSSPVQLEIWCAAA
jgi:hypothetical protein